MNKLNDHVNSEYLELVEAIVAQYKKCTYRHMRINSGHKVLDVGCGPGIDTVHLAPLVGETGYVCGVDNNIDMITEANNRVLNERINRWVKHYHCDAMNLPFELDYFDSTRSERVFQHLVNPEIALSEMIRVTKKGGRVVVLDTDWSTLSIDNSEFKIEQILKQIRIEKCLENATSGRQLYRLFKQHELVEISVELCPIYLTNYSIGKQSIMLDKVEKTALVEEIITKDELEKWHKCLEEYDFKETFFGSVNQVLVSGTKH